jgi:hypothetical protein
MSGRAAVIVARVETRGRVVELERRGYVSAALVELDDEAGVFWLPADALVLLRPVPH